jgi:hypothetical protein
MSDGPLPDGCWTNRHWTFVLSAAQIVGRYSLPTKKRGGSILGHLYMYRDREGGHTRMY